jgi:hypothetical protein
MTRVLLVFAVIATTIGMAMVKTATAEDPFRFEFGYTESHRGVAIAGYVYNPLPWRITNVRLQVESVDATGAVVASSSGWVLGDVAARGRGYFYVPVPAQAATYRPSVQAFDKVMLESPQAP